MKKRTIISLTTLVAVLASVFILTQGCEDDADTSGSDLDNYFDNNPYVSDPRSSNSNLSIDPEKVTISAKGEEVLFTVRGGDGHYSWDTATRANGTVKAQTDNDDQAIYEVLLLTKNNVIVSDGNGEAAIAEITYSASALTITPSAITLTNGATATLTGSGGAEPYTWDLVFDSKGHLSNPVAPSIDYTADVTNFVNTIVLTDDNGSTATASITHSP